MIIFNNNIYDQFMMQQYFKDIQNGRVKNTVHKTYNCIVVFNREKDAALF